MLASFTCYCYLKLDFCRAFVCFCFTLCMLYLQLRYFTVYVFFSGELVDRFQKQCDRTYFYSMADLITRPLLFHPHSQKSSLVSQYRHVSFLPTTLVVQVEQTVRCMCVRVYVCVCPCLRAIIFKTKCPNCPKCLAR